MPRRSWEAKTCSATQEIPNTLRNPKVHDPANDLYPEPDQSNPYSALLLQDKF
jgi:hypothetical protein